jgi:hypothetical protein
LELLLMLWLLLMAAWHAVETAMAAPGKLSACLSLAVDPASLQSRWDGSNQRSLCRTFCPCLLIGLVIGYCRYGFPLLRGQLSEEAANAGLALERHFVGLPSLADQYKVDPPLEMKQKRFVTRARARSFFWCQKVQFWGRTFVTKVQKSFICPIKDRFGLQPEFIKEPFVALRYICIGPFFTLYFGDAFS